ncbi:hypothetical protein MKK65_18135 [Methylobacterium sp. J-001]|uniref:hypothetical protein n=1 Tax=unclassified Methylobacterium TaxID=2615210 RepID=UPI001FB98DC3|nr:MULTISPECIES: hypothetical protein [unclassified Methylobacterium]MCJ2095955.1 hypothetical protein [Methylobacterium sp. J-072]MCJ2118464.1 hypothetical protein [Methylobacterium sp. J-001]
MRAMFTRSICAAAIISAFGIPASAQEATAVPGNSPATWEKPLPLFPVGPEVAPPEEQSVLSIVPGTGLVKGTTSALDTIGQPLPETPGRNRTVETCRNTIIGKARKDGMTEVEAVSVGEDKTDKDGDYFAPVRFRITYQKPMMYEVREATMICVVDKVGNIVDTYVPAISENR